MQKALVLINISPVLATTVKDPCKGKVYKYIEGMFIGRTGNVILKTEFRPMKRLSCKGCEQCYWVEELLAEDISSDKFPIFDDFENVASCYTSISTKRK